MILLAVAGTISAQEGTSAFHTDPACWSEPRLYHAGPPPGPLANRIHLIEAPAVEPPGPATTSPNGAYRFWVRAPDTTRPGPWGAGLIVDHERDRHLVVLIEDVAGSIAPRWINEKLIYLRVAWGRITFSDLILDVETGELIFHEVVEDGAIAYEQFQGACSGVCPCPATDPHATGSSGSAPATNPASAAPASVPAQDAPIGLLLLPTVFGAPEQGGVVPATNPVPVPVYDRPTAGAIKLAELVDIGDFEYREYTYEGAAAVVYEARPSWYRIGVRATLPGGSNTAWISATSAGEFLPVAALIADSLAYLNGSWDGHLWSAAGGGTRSARSRLVESSASGERREYTIRVLETRMIGENLWIHVETGRDPCGGGELARGGQRLGSRVQRSGPAERLVPLPWMLTGAQPPPAPRTRAGPAGSLTYEGGITADDRTPVAELSREQLVADGWTEAESNEMGATLQVLFTKGNRTTGITLMPGNPGVVVQIAALTLPS